MNHDSNEYNASAALHGGRDESFADAFCEPLALTSAYTFSSAQDAFEKFSGQRQGNVYSRFTNPTVRTFERRMAALEGAQDAAAFATGMGAITALCHALLRQGDNVVCSRDVFGTTIIALRNYMGRFGIEVRLVELTDLDAWARHIDEKTRLVLLESPSNPLLNVADLRGICRIAHAHGARVAVDNTLLTPVFQRPHAFGADLVVHSAGKYIDGQGRALAGVITGSSELVGELRGVLRSLGISCSPFNAWLLLKSLETLEVRMERVADSALALASWLRQQAQVEAVHYTGLAEHPQHALANEQQHGHGGLLSFRLHGGRPAAWAWIDALQLVARCTNIGDTRSMVTHPATTTHCRLSAGEQQAAGICEGLVRLSVGLERLDDLKTDLDTAFSAAKRSLQTRPGNARVYEVAS
jgi:O-succinylhomoserine sulfhydrylase